MKKYIDVNALSIFKAGDFAKAAASPPPAGGGIAP